jgi:hypothetical protein
LNDPLVAKIATAVIGMIVINLLVRFLQGLTSSHVESSDMRYGIRRGLTFFGYLAAILLIIGIFGAIAQTDGKVSMASVPFHLFEAPTLDIRL